MWRSWLVLVVGLAIVVWFVVAQMWLALGLTVVLTAVAAWNERRHGVPLWPLWKTREREARPPG